METNQPPVAASKRNLPARRPQPARGEASVLTNLIELCEAASGPDRELDTAIWLAATSGATRKETVIPDTPLRRGWVIDETRLPNGLLITVPSYTASLDAAMTLVPKTWKIHFLQDTEYDNPAEKTWSVALRPRDDNPVGNEEQSWCATPPLAMCAAALRARAAQ